MALHSGHEGQPHHHHNGALLAVSGGVLAMAAFVFGPRIMDGGTSEAPNIGGDAPASAPAVPGGTESATPSASPSAIETIPQPNKKIARIEAITDMDTFDQLPPEKKMSYVDWLIDKYNLKLASVKPLENTVNGNTFPDSNTITPYLNDVMTAAAQIYGDGQNPATTLDALKLIGATYNVNPDSNPNSDLCLGEPYASCLDPAGINGTVNYVYRIAAQNGEPFPTPATLVDEDFADTFGKEGPMTQLGITLDPEAEGKKGAADAQYAMTTITPEVNGRLLPFVVGWRQLTIAEAKGNTPLDIASIPFPTAS